jgi:hypothetical protein
MFVSVSQWPARTCRKISTTPNCVFLPGVVQFEAVQSGVGAEHQRADGSNAVDCGQEPTAEDRALR